jgi:hypothetical protein
VPAHRYDVIAVGLQECNARDEWLRAIEAALREKNAKQAVPVVEPHKPAIEPADGQFMSRADNGNASY